MHSMLPATKTCTTHTHTSALARHLVPAPGSSTPSRAAPASAGSSWVPPGGLREDDAPGAVGPCQSLPGGWKLSISAEDNDPDRFFRYLLAAWEEVQPGIRDSPLGLLLGAMDPDRDAVLSAFINVASDLPDHLVIILDDHHVIDEPSIHAALNFLLDNLPPTLHFAFAGRREPPLPLARYRARGEVLELGVEDLRFSEEETRAFLKQLSIPDLC